METKAKIYDQHAENTEWTSKLNFYKDEIKIMTGRLEEVAAKNSSKEVLAQVERFQNQMIIQRNNIDEALHAVKINEEKLQAEINENPVAVDHRSVEYHAIEKDMVDSFEKIPVSIHSSSKEGSRFVAAEIGKLIRDKQKSGEKCVIGLGTGSTPISMYAELVRLHREEGLSFANVVTFNLDEYYPIEKEAFQSYWSFMHRHLFSHVDIDPKNIHLPNSEWNNDELKENCVAYEQTIEKLGGIDLQILGIGKNGHIGFNEPGSHVNSGTRSITLDL